MNNNHFLQRLLMSGTGIPPAFASSSESSPFTNTGYLHRATTQQLDAFFANALTQLNAQQRESILEEIHGIRNNADPESSPALVNTWLQMFDIHLQSNKQGTVYEVAEAIDRSYVTSTSFRMMFLRASRYDPHAAALQVIKFLEVKRSLFGQEKLTRKITLVDLSEEEKEFLASGAVQISAKRDRSGRGIILFFPSLHKEGTPIEATIRARYYAMMSLLESEENQKNGIVSIYFCCLPNTTRTQQSAEAGLLWVLPFYWAGIHGCLDDWEDYVRCSTSALRMPVNLRPRVRAHYGSCTECLYQLLTFGIPRDAILTDSNEPRLVEHTAWYRRRQEMELAYVTDSDASVVSSAMGCDIVPRPADVLSGSGSRSNKGNIYMKSLVLNVLDEYNEANKRRKMQLTEHVINEVTKRGGRFLKQQPHTKEWEEASHTEACRKIAHAFRNIRRPSRAKKQE